MSGSNSERAIVVVVAVVLLPPLDALVLTGAEVVVVVVGALAEATGRKLADWRRVRPRLGGEEEDDDGDIINNVEDAMGEVDVERAVADADAASSAWLVLLLPYNAEAAAPVDRNSKDWTTWSSMALVDTMAQTSCRWGVVTMLLFLALLAWTTMRVARASYGCGGDAWRWTKRSKATVAWRRILFLQIASSSVGTVVEVGVPSSLFTRWQRDWIAPIVGTNKARATVARLVVACRAFSNLVRSVVTTIRDMTSARTAMTFDNAVVETGGGIVVAVVDVVVEAVARLLSFCSWINRWRVDVARIIQYPARDDEVLGVAIVVVDDEGEEDNPAAAAAAIVVDALDRVVDMILVLPVHLTSANAWKVVAANSGVDDNSKSVW
jgi:hypothetical protein